MQQEEETNLFTTMDDDDGSLWSLSYGDRTIPEWDWPARVHRAIRVNYRVTRIASRLFTTYKLFCLLVWIILGTYLWTTISPVQSTYCPNSQYASIYSFLFLLWGLASHGLVIKFGHYSVMLSFCLVSIWWIARLLAYLQRLTQYNLTDHELDFYRKSESKLFAIGQCMMAHKMALGVVHFELVLMTVMGLVHCAPMLTRWVIALCGRLAKGLSWVSRRVGRMFYTVYRVNKR